MIHVYLDDMRPCPRGFVLARTVRECICLLEECEVDVLSLDHDLGWDEPNGFEVVKHMVLHELYPKEIYLHTSSVIGRMKMFQLLYQRKPEHVKVHNAAIPWERLEQIAAETDRR